MTSRLFLLTIIALFTLPLANCEAQKLKLPNLMPFKKKTNEVKPFELTDRSGKANARQGRLLDFLKPQERSRKSKNQMAGQTKSFFDKAGQDMGSGLDRFTQGTKKFFSDAWNPPKAHKAWWNQGPSNNGQAQAKADTPFVWPGSRSARTQPPMQAPRTANQYKYGQPKHRFK